MPRQACVPRPALAAPRRRGLSTAALLSLVSIASVLVFVSIPRLRSLALQENEADAHDTLVLFQGAFPAFAAERAAPAQQTIEELARRRTIRRALSDAEFLESGRVLRRHGYLFRLVEHSGRLPGQRTRARAADLGILAWPWEHGATGTAAFFFAADGRIFRHANTPALWNGPDASRAPELSDGTWVELP